MIFDKPVVFIGILGEADFLADRARQIGWGIEEESCLSEPYKMRNREDIRYSMAETTVVLLENEGWLYVNDLNKNNCLLSVTGSGNESYRLLGKNAARYLKKRKLCLNERSRKLRRNGS